MDELGMVNNALLERVMEVKMLREQLRALKAENERLREALEEIAGYASEDNFVEVAQAALKASADE